MDFCFDESPFTPASLTYCAIGFIAFPKETSGGIATAEQEISDPSCISLKNWIRWIIDGQTTYVEEEENEAQSPDPSDQTPLSGSTPMPTASLSSPHVAQTLSATTTLPSPKTSSAEPKQAERSYSSIGLLDPLVIRELRWAGSP